MENAMKYMVVLSCVILLIFNDITVSVLCEPLRERRQAAPAYNDDYADGNDNEKKDEDTKADYKSPYAGAEDIVDDAPADDADDKDKLDDTPKHTVDDAVKETPQDNDRDFGGDDFTAPAPESSPKQASSSSEELKKLKAELEKLKKGKKRKKFVKDVINYLKKVLTPQNLMQNQWVIQMLRKFSNSADDEYKSAESVEQTQQLVKRRRGRPRGRKSKKKLPSGLKGLIAYGLRSMTEIDRRKLRRNLRYVRRFARKAKKPLKAAVRMFLSTRTNGDMGGMGGGGGGGNNYGNNY